MITASGGFLRFLSHKDLCYQVKQVKCRRSAQVKYSLQTLRARQVLEEHCANALATRLPEACWDSSIWLHSELLQEHKSTCRWCWADQLLTAEEALNSC